MHDQSLSSSTLLVDDVQGAADALRGAGVRFVSPDVTTVSETALGFSRAVMVRDPDGHTIRTSAPDSAGQSFELMKLAVVDGINAVRVRKR